MRGTGPKTIGMAISGTEGANFFGMVEVETDKDGTVTDVGKRDADTVTNEEVDVTGTEVELEVDVAGAVGILKVVIAGPESAMDSEGVDVRTSVLGLANIFQGCCVKAE